MSRKQLGQELVDRGLLSEAQLASVLEQQDRPERLGESLVAQNLVSKADIGQALESVKDVAYVECPPGSVDPKALALIPGGVAYRCCALPLLIEGNALVVAMAEPQDVGHLEELAFAAGMQVSPRFSFVADVRKGLDRFYGGVLGPLADEQLAPIDDTHAFDPQRTSPTSDRSVQRGWVPMGLALCLAFGGGLLLGDSLDLLDSTEQTSTAAAVSEPPAAGLEPIMTAGSGGYMIQVGVFRSQANAHQLAEDLRVKDGRVQTTRLPGELYSVTMGPFENRETAARITDEIRREIELSPFELPRGR